MFALRFWLPYLKTAALVAVATALAGGVLSSAPLDSVSAVYMLPVLISAIRAGRLLRPDLAARGAASAG